MIIRKGKSQITFVYMPAQPCKKVQLAGTFNNWSPDGDKMARQKDGSYRKRLTLPPGEHRYKFIVDDQWIHDPDGEALAWNELGSQDSIVRVG